MPGLAVAVYVYVAVYVAGMTCEYTTTVRVRTPRVRTPNKSVPVPIWRPLLPPLVCNAPCRALSARAQRAFGVLRALHLLLIH